MCINWLLCVFWVCTEVKQSFCTLLNFFFLYKVQHWQCFFITILHQTIFSHSFICPKLKIFFLFKIFLFRLWLPAVHHFCAPTSPPLSPLHNLWWSRKWSSLDVLYSPSRLGRNQDVLLSAGMIVSALAGRFVSLQVIFWMDNDRYTFPAIFQCCRTGSEKHSTQWPRGHLCEQESRLLQSVELDKDNHPVRHKNSRWPRDLRLEAGAGFGHWWLQIQEMEGGWWGNIEEVTLDFWRVWWTLMGGRSRRMKGVTVWQEGGRGWDEEGRKVGGVWQHSWGHLLDLWFSLCFFKWGDCRVYAHQGKGDVHAFLIYYLTDLC